MYLLLFLVVTLVSSVKSQGPAAAPSPASSWNTLDGFQPVVISSGEGLYPDQTLPAYRDALDKSAGGLFLYCDLQLTKDGLGLCRTDLDLSKSTSVADAFPNLMKTYNVNGMNVSGYFSIDFTLDQLINNVTAKQAQPSRPPYLDGQLLFTPENVQTLLLSYTNVTGFSAFLWINVEYSKFYEEHKINTTSYLLSAIRKLTPAYISSTEVSLLRTLRPRLSKTKTRTIFKIPSVDDVEPTTEQTYGDILNNLTSIRSFASGLLVPKDIIWVVNNDSYFVAPTTLVRDAHRQKLEVHAYTFAIDTYPSFVYNYSYDPITEVLYYIDSPGFSVDGVLTDYPATASMAIECYAGQGGKASSAEVTNKAVLPPFNGKQVITHSGGDSGNYPGSTRLSYTSAISKGADYIDCPVQITKDGVAICRQSPDLFLTTNVASTPLLTRSKTVSSIQQAPGIFTFDLTWAEINTLKAQIVTLYPQEGLPRDPSHDGVEGLLTLSDFLSIAKDNPKVGVYLVLENAYLINGTMGLDTVGAVISSLKEAGFDNKSNVVIQSEDSSVLRSLRTLTSAELIYYVPVSNVSLTDAVLTEIKQFADGVAVPRALVNPVNNFIIGETDVVSRVHNHSLSLLVSYFRNEFVSRAFDFLSDPTLELNTFAQFYKIDGFITDFPQTAKSYLTNRCLRDPNGYQIPLIKFGNPDIATPPASAPFPPLSIAEPPLPESVAPAPAPSTKGGEKSFGVMTLPGVWLVTTCLILHFLGEVHKQL